MDHSGKQQDTQSILWVEFEELLGFALLFEEDASCCFKMKAK